MAIVTVFWVLLFGVLVAAAVTGLRHLGELQRMKRQRPQNPFLEIKRLYDLGEITRDQYETMINDELRHPHEQQRQAS